MLFNPKMLFLLNPIPRRRRESGRTEGKESPVLESTSGSGESARESEPQSGTERLAKKKFSASWRNGCFGFATSLMDIAAPTTAADAAATVKAVAVALKGRDLAEEEEEEGLMG